MEQRGIMLVRSSSHILSTSSFPPRFAHWPAHTSHREPAPFLVMLQATVTILTFLSNHNLTLLWLLILSATMMWHWDSINTLYLAHTGKWCAEAIITTDLEQNLQTKICYRKQQQQTNKKLVWAMVRQSESERRTGVLDLYQEL